MSKPSKAVPFEITLLVRDACLCLHTQRAARALARHFDEVLRPVGLTNQQFSLLMALNRPQPPSMAPVSRLLGMDRTTLTAALKPLERRGLVCVAPSPTDARTRLLVLTEAGSETLAAALPIWRSSHAELESRITSVTPDALRAGLAEISTIGPATTMLPIRPHSQARSPDQAETQNGSVKHPAGTRPRRAPPLPGSPRP
jgi:DNA-binding MarR family transcriptional regulator